MSDKLSSLELPSVSSASLSSPPSAALLASSSWSTSMKTSETDSSPGQEMMGWECYQIDYMQIICTWCQTDNHTNNSSLNFYRPDALPDAQPTVAKAQSTANMRLLHNLLLVIH